MHVPDAHVSVVVLLIGSKLVHLIIEAQVDSTGLVEDRWCHKGVIQSCVELVHIRSAIDFDGV